MAKRKSYKTLWLHEQTRRAVANEKADELSVELARVRKVLSNYAQSHVIPHLPGGNDVITLHPIEWEAMSAAISANARFDRDDTVRTHLISWRGRPIVTRHPSMTRCDIMSTRK